MSLSIYNNLLKYFKLMKQKTDIMNSLFRSMLATAAVGVFLITESQAILIGHWAFDEGSGVIASDFSGFR